MTLPVENHLTTLRTVFGDRLQENVSLSDYTTVHVGGMADGFVVFAASVFSGLAGSGGAVCASALTTLVDL